MKHLIELERADYMLLDRVLQYALGEGPAPDADAVLAVQLKIARQTYKQLKGALA